jgi:hypothetical protein
MAQSNVVQFANMDEEPLQIHIEVTDGTDNATTQIKFKWVSNVRGTPLVKLGEKKGEYGKVFSGNDRSDKASTYTADDLCGFPARNTMAGWFHHPGVSVSFLSFSRP